jgi:hypothetical protein
MVCTYRTVVVSGTWSIKSFPFRSRRKKMQLSTLPHTHALQIIIIYCFITYFCYIFTFYCKNVFINAAR